MNDRHTRADPKHESGGQHKHVQDRDMLEPFGICQVKHEIAGQYDGKIRGKPIAE